MIKQDYSYIQADNRKVTTEMTLPDERYQAVLEARLLLLDLILPHRTPRMTQQLRDRASAILKHFPYEWEMEAVADHLPSLFRKELDDVERFIRRGLDGQGK